MELAETLTNRRALRCLESRCVCVFVSSRGMVLSQKKKYGAKHVRCASGGGMSAKREEVEMKTKTKKEGRDCTN